MTAGNRIWAPAVASFGLLACGSPNLEITFDLPDAWASDVSNVILGIYAHPGDPTFGCEELAFQDVGDETRLILWDEIVVQPGEPAVTMREMSSEGAVTILAQAYDEENQRLGAGCVDQANLRSTAPVVLPGEPSTVYELDVDPDQLHPDTGQVQLPLTFEPAPTDAGGDLLPAARGRWRVIASNGVCADCQGNWTSGEVVVANGTPGPGPFVVESRARWANKLPTTLSGFTSPPVFTWPVPAPNGQPSDHTPIDLEIGAVGPNGEAGLVVLHRANTGDRDYHLTHMILVPGDPPQLESSTTAIPDMANIDLPATLIMMPPRARGAPIPTLIGLSTSGPIVWEVPANGDNPSSYTFAGPPSSAPVEAVLAGACGSALEKSELLIAFQNLNTGADSYRIYDQTTEGLILRETHAFEEIESERCALVQGCKTDCTQEQKNRAECLRNADLVRLNSSACLATSDDTEERSIILTEPSQPGAFNLVVDEGGLLTLEIRSQGSPIVAGAENASPNHLLHRLSNAGSNSIIVASMLDLSTPDELLSREVFQQKLPFPARLPNAQGDLDGDGGADLLFLADDRFLGGSLFRPGQETRLTGASTDLFPIAADLFSMVDLNHDGRDDLIAVDFDAPSWEVAILFF